MQSFFLSHHSSLIHYLLGGAGDKLLICFHGYGESAASFAFLETALGKDFIILAIDLPFHGKTEWREGLSFEPQELITLIERITASPPFTVLAQSPEAGVSPGPPGIPAAKWWLMGYSMGGRVALSLLENKPEKIEKIILLAPDGLSINRWYWLTTQTRLGNTLFRWTMQNPGWFSFILSCGKALKVINRSIYKLTRHYVGQPSVRKELYIRWTTMRKFKPDIPAIQTLILKQQIPVRILYGLHDRIIQSEKGKKFRKGGIGTYCRLSFLPVGHQLLQAGSQEMILSLLKD